MVWSGWEGDTNGEQDIYIAKMKDPLTIESQRVKISSPQFGWEQYGDLKNPKDDPPHINVNEGPQGLVHGDYRLDNMLFGTADADRALTVVDWQTVSWGPALTDLSYFLGCALSTQDRRTEYEALLRAYHEALGPAAPITFDDVAEGVRRQSFFGVMMAIVSSMLVERTERGDRMFMTMLERHCDHVLDTDALATLPAAVAPKQK